MKFLSRVIFWIVFLLIAVIAVTVISSNQQTVNIDILFTKVEVQIGLALLVGFAVGWLFGILSMLLPWLKRANKARVLGKKLKTKEKEVDNLRQLPMSNPDQL